MPSQRTTSNPTTTPPSKQPVTSPTEQIFLGDENICLSNPEDTYRTCFQRAGTSNGLTEDQILPREYNIGAALYERNISSSDLSYIPPYTAPNVTSDEELTNGIVYLSMVSRIIKHWFSLNFLLSHQNIGYVVGEKQLYWYLAQASASSQNVLVSRKCWRLWVIHADMCLHQLLCSLWWSFYQ